jgi:hypothetical protein
LGRTLKSLVCRSERTLRPMLCFHAETDGARLTEETRINRQSFPERQGEAFLSFCRPQSFPVRRFPSLGRKFFPNPARACPCGFTGAVKEGRRSGGRAGIPVGKDGRPGLPRQGKRARPGNEGCLGSELTPDAGRKRVSLRLKAELGPRPVFGCSGRRRDARGRRSPSPEPKGAVLRGARRVRPEGPRGGLSALPAYPDNGRGFRSLDLPSGVFCLGDWRTPDYRTPRDGQSERPGSALTPVPPRIKPFSKTMRPGGNKRARSSGGGRFRRLARVSSPFRKLTSRRQEYVRAISAMRGLHSGARGKQTESRAMVGSIILWPSPSLIIRYVRGGRVTDASKIMPNI